MTSQELQKRVEVIFNKLFIANESIPIIVEGKKDEEALRKLGASGTIIRLNTGQSIFQFCEELARDYKQVIILTDWDAKGQQLFNRLKRDLQNNCVKAIDNFWLEFKRYCSKEIHEVEFLTKFSLD